MISYAQIQSLQVNMNLNHLSSQLNQHDSGQSENDLGRLIQICSSYGLNQEETEQLISQFKRGALYQSEQSFNDSLNQSLSQMTFSQKNEREEYSFKHQHSQEPNICPQIHKKDWIDIEERKKSKANLNSSHLVEPLEQILQQKNSVEKSLMFNLQEQNKKLKADVDDRDAKINDLLTMKRQDTQIILGLKDIIANLTNSLQQKQSSFQQINHKYVLQFDIQSVMMQSKVRGLSQVKSSTDIETLQQISNNTFGNNYKNNQKSPIESSKVKMSQEDDGLAQSKMSNGDYFDNSKKFKKSSRIDIKKYKEMIENMRNNY